MSKDMTILLN